MNRRGRESDRALVLGIVALAILTIAIGVWMDRSQFSPPSKRFLSGFKKHVLAMELVCTTRDVQEIVGDLGDPNREVMRSKVQRDFLFIPSYALLFVALGWLLGRSNYRFTIWLAVAIVVCAAGAAVFDVMENLRIFHVLDARLADTTQEMLDGLRRASLAKWALVFVAMTLVSPIGFFRRELFTLPIGGSRLAVVFGVTIMLAYLLGGIIGLAGLRQNLLIETASIFMSLALLLTVLLLLTVFFARGRQANDSREGG